MSDTYTPSTERVIAAATEPGAQITPAEMSRWLESVRAEARDGGIDDANMAWQMTLLAHTDLTPEDVGTVLAHLSDGFRRVRAIDVARIAREGA